MSPPPLQAQAAPVSLLPQTQVRRSEKRPDDATEGAGAGSSHGVRRNDQRLRKAVSDLTPGTLILRGERRRAIAPGPGTNVYGSHGAPPPPGLHPPAQRKVPRGRPEKDAPIVGIVARTSQDRRIDILARRMIPLMPTRSAVATTISARHTILRGVFRLAQRPARAQPGRVERMEVPKDRSEVRSPRPFACLNG